MLEIVSSDKAIELLIPTPISRLSLSSKFSFVCGSSDLPLCFKNPNLVLVDACMARSLTVPYLRKTSISALDLIPSIIITFDFEFSIYGATNSATAP